MAIPKTPAITVFRYIVGDFEAAWSALIARKGHHKGGGNFMFALMSMILLEFACRVCSKDLTKGKLTRLTNALKAIEPRYFTPLPGKWGRTREFTLPGAHPDSHLLGMMFDLIRNGKAHQYRSAIVTLSDGEVDVDITGAASGRELTKAGRRRPTKHLRYKVSLSGDLHVYVRTDQLFLDLKRAIENSKVISSSDLVTDVARLPNPAKSWYVFKVADLDDKLKAGGHLRGRW